MSSEFETKASAKADTEDEVSRPLNRLPIILATGQPDLYEGLPADDNDLDLTVKDGHAGHRENRRDLNLAIKDCHTRSRTARQ